MTRHVSDATRRDQIKPGSSITVLARSDQLSAWSRDLLYGGGLLVAALVLAAGFTVVRPRPRRRPPEVAAPAWAERGKRRR
jgi:hypothetical protein